MRRAGVAVVAGLLAAGLGCVAAGMRGPGAEDWVQAGVYDGVWVGETSEGEEIRITVDGGWVMGIETNFNLQTTEASATRPRLWPVRMPIVDDGVQGHHSGGPWVLGCVGSFEEGELTGVLHVEWVDPWGNLGRRHVGFSAVARYGVFVSAYMAGEIKYAYVSTGTQALAGGVPLGDLKVAERTLKAREQILAWLEDQGMAVREGSYSVPTDLRLMLATAECLRGKE